MLLQQQDQQPEPIRFVPNLSKLINALYNSDYLDVDQGIDNDQFRPLIIKNNRFVIGEPDEEPIKTEHPTQPIIESWYIDMVEVTASKKSQLEFKAQLVGLSKLL